MEDHLLAACSHDKGGKFGVVKADMADGITLMIKEELISEW